MLDVHSQTILAVIERIQASIECQCSYCLEQRGAQMVLMITRIGVFACGQILCISPNGLQASHGIN